MLEEFYRRHEASASGLDPEVVHRLRREKLAPDQRIGTTLEVTLQLSSVESCRRD